MSKVIKDPIYGYVNIQKNIMNEIVDTACFQRLRSIRQTSYSPLYHASIHNRFTHSIGVYFLGEKAINSSYITYNDIFNESDWKQHKQTFLLACLLHDVGHAPFSHTGERFFLDDKDEDNEIRIYNLLSECVGCDDFSADVEKFHKTKLSPAAPHEIMSVIVAIKNFSSFFHSKEEKSFFARCITGYKYQNIDTPDKSFLNCLIELLNSSIIDVDKLDYIIRDAFTTGFQSVSIDYCRLLDAVSINKDTDSSYKLSYHKSALSVIENVIYAHDSERKWIQNHPVVLYENFLVQYAIKTVDKYYRSKGTEKRLFSYESISEEGNDAEGDTSLKLLSDEDIIHNIKNNCFDELTKEYFARNERRRPIWKSEAEYRALFEENLGVNKLNELEDSFKKLEKYLEENMEHPIINENFLTHCNQKLEKLETAQDIDKANLENLKKGTLELKKLADSLKNFSKQNNIPFEFVVIGANKFKSGFLKADIEELTISFPSFNEVKKMKDISSILEGQKTNRDKFFYLFYKKSGEEININEFATTLQRSLF